MLKMLFVGYLKAFVGFYKVISIIVLGAIALYAMSQVSGLSVIVCIAIGWFIHKKYAVSVKKKKQPKKKVKKA